MIAIVLTDSQQEARQYFSLSVSAPFEKQRRIMRKNERNELVQAECSNEDYVFVSSALILTFPFSFFKIDTKLDTSKKSPKLFVLSFLP